jgi:hypothetical protein
MTNAATFARAWSLAERSIAAKGEPIVLRQRARVEYTTGPTAGSASTSPLSTATLAAVGAHLAGVSLVTLDAALVTGLLVAGDRLTFAGHSQVYVVTGGPYAAAGNTLANVAITPALVENVANDEAVRVEFTGTDAELLGLFTRTKLQMVDGTLTRVGDYRVLVAQLSLDEAGVTPARGDELFRGTVAGGRRMTIVELEPLVSDAAVYLIAKEG